MKFALVLLSVLAPLVASAGEMTCNAVYTSREGQTTIIAENAVVKADVSMTGSEEPVVIKNTLASDGKPYELALRAYVFNGMVNVEIRQTCHTDWQCSFARSSAKSLPDAKQIELFDGTLTNEGQPQYEAGTVTVVCKQN